MVTKNQKHVAEALRLARDESFLAGHNYLLEGGLKGTRPEQTEWFINKCSEHNIPIPPNARYLVVTTLTKAFTNAASQIRAAMVGLTKTFGSAMGVGSLQRTNENSYHGY